MLTRRSFFGLFPAAAVATAAVAAPVSAPPVPPVVPTPPEPPPHVSPLAFWYMRALDDISAGDPVVCMGSGSGLVARKARGFERVSGLALATVKAGEFLSVQVGRTDGPVRQTPALS